MSLTFISLITVFTFIYSPIAFCVYGESSSDLTAYSTLMDLEECNKKGDNIAFSPSIVIKILKLIGSLTQGKEHDIIKRTFCPSISGDITLETALAHSDLSDETMLASIFAYKQDAHKWMRPEYAQQIEKAEENSEFCLLREGGKTAINNFVSAKTNGKITELINRDPTEKEIVFGATIYYKGDWKEKFKQCGTRLFTKQDGSTVPAKFMKKTAYYKTITGTDPQNDKENVLIRIPYKVDGVVMDIAMPSLFREKNTDFPPKNWNECLKSAQLKSFVLIMPEWNQSHSIDLTDYLKYLGLGKLLEKDESATNSFLRSMTEPSYINQAKIETKVDVDKDGTTAASAASVSCTSLFSASLPSPEILINRPFYYFIHDLSKEGIAFCGKINNPSKK